MSVQARLEQLGIVLPPPPQPAGAYAPAVRTGDLVFVAGQLPSADGQVQFKGQLGRDLDVAAGQQAARLCALNALSVLAAACGSLDAVRRIVRVGGFICSAPEFTDQPLVLNGASELIAQVLGPAGVHARVAVGCPCLPLGAAVELELLAEAAQV
mgnify:CR=1 FL=1